MAAEFAAFENIRRRTKKENSISRNDVYNIEMPK
jgi:hypothetical protein